MYIAVCMRILVNKARASDVNIAMLVFTRYSAILFLSCLDLGHKTFLYIFVDFALCPVLLLQAA